MMWKKTGKSIALSAALLLTAPVTMAQEESGFSDEKLSQYASARSEIKEVSQSYRGDMQQAENKKEAQKLRKEMQDAMVGAVKSSGLSVEEYNKITKAMRQDKELQSKVRSMQSNSGDKGGGSSGTGSS